MQESERADFISAMRYVANSVSVVTTGGAAGRHGATVSAFCSVSADPPTILVCLHAKSRIAECVERNQTFNINVLPDNASLIADRFAGKQDPCIADRFEGIDLGQSEVPTIAGSTVFCCDLQDAILSGSHKIIIGRVKQTIRGDAMPLAYLDGAYRQIKPLSEARN